MSLETWKDEYYPVPAHKVSAKDALAHSLRKWEGLRAKNLARHRVSVDNSGDLFDGQGNCLDVDGGTCALCCRWPKDGCRRCPVSPCGDAYEDWWDSIPHNPEPMIRLIAAAIRRAEKRA